MTNHSEDSLVIGIRNRSNESFKYLESKVKDAVRLMVVEKGGTRTDAEDVYNDGIEILIKKLDDPDFDLSCSVPTLLYAICDRKWKQVLEKRFIHNNYLIRHNEHCDTIDYSENQDLELYKKILWDCLQTLDRSCRQILKACLKETPLKELAELLDYSYGHLRKKKCICHAYLMEKIRKHPDVVFIREKEGIQIEI